ncbi:stage V sporulation protein AE [Caldinitratiruptor microaerophilus]|uniref:Stage V sporulation protein AE n=1 Tax=Caldinitratiruptor microaerophilus TaxID=671077 RepID=A0AA35G7E7_9FIRM|nr:stage V sporulation protein AE [Caldinitratiruptor microaerophilus]BDG60021.1 stage V sporulation protein AE [Caldinitratiruptor microaerophilus]
MIYLKAFLVGGLICLIAQLILDNTKYTNGHVLTGLTVAGGILGGLGLYDRLVDFAGAGATVPISSFGNALVQGALMEARAHGLVGILTGMFEMTSSGIAAAIVFGFLTALVFNPKG